MEQQNKYRVIVSARAAQMLVSHAAFLAQVSPAAAERHGTPASEQPVPTRSRGIYFAAPCPAASLIALRIMEVTSSTE